MASVEFALGGYMRARLETWEGDTSIPNNTSVVYARIKVWRTNSWSGQTYSSSVRREIWIDGSCVCDWTGEISHYNSYGEIEVASGSKTITHNSDGTRSVGVQAYLTDNITSYFTGSGSLDMTLGTIPRGSSGTFSKSTYTIGEEIKINFDRKSSSFTHSGYIQYPDRDGWIWAGEKYFSGAGTSWSWTPTQAEKEMLYGRVPNAQSAKMWADCKTMNGGTEISQFSVGQAIMKVNPDECRPLFSNYTFADTNSTTTAITGNNQVMISGKSTLAVTISAANKATARLSATMKKYTFQAAGLTAEETYTTSAITKTLGSPTVDANETPSATRDLVVTALDSRSISTPVTKQITIVPYSSPKISATATRANGFENSTTVNISGSFSRIEVGGTAKNTVKTSNGVQYRYRQQGTSTWGSWTNRTATIDSATGKVTVAQFTLNLDNQSAFEFQFRITDKLETTTVSLTVSVGQPAFYIGADGRVGVGGMPTISKLTGEQGLLEVAGRAFANGHQLAELPIDSTNVNFDNFTSNHYDFVKIFEYYQETASSSDVTVTVPVDFTDATGYKEIIIESAHEPSDTSTLKWISVGARTASGTSNIACQQRGVELAPSGTWITRDHNEIIACGASSWASSHFWLRIIRANEVNYPSFIGFGMGGDPGYAQILQGRIKAGANAVKKIRVPLATPQVGGWVKAYARK